MAHSSDSDPITRVDVAIHEIAVSITTSNLYPDQLDDITNRAQELLDRVLVRAQSLGIDIRRFNYSDWEEELEETEEEAD